MTAREPRAPARGFWAGALAIVVLAAALRFAALDAGLPHLLTRPDEEVVLAQTGSLARGDANLEWAVYPAAYVYLTWAWTAAGLRAGQALGLLPPGTYHQVLRDHPDRVLLVGRVSTAAAGTAAVALVVAAGRAALGGAPALAAGALLATSFLHARDSHALKPDALFSLAVLGALWAMVPLMRGATLVRAAGAGAALGLALATKYPAVLLLAPAYVAAVLGSPARGWRRLVPSAALVVAATAALVFLATSPSLLINPRTRGEVVALLSTLVPVGWPGSITNLLPAGAPSPYPGPWWEGYWYHATFSLRYGAGLAATLLTPVALVWGFASRRPLPLLAAVFVVVYGAVHGLSPVFRARYMTAILPLLALLEAGCLWGVAQRVGGRRAGLVLAGLTALVAAEPLGSAIAHNRLAVRTDTRVLATRWMAEQLPRGTRIGVLGTWFWAYGVPHMPPGVQRELLEPDLAALEAAGVRYVLTHDHMLRFSHVDPERLEALAPHLRLLVEFDPLAPEGTHAVYEPGDAYYIPFHDFGGVERPGPRIRIYEFRR